VSGIALTFSAQTDSNPFQVVSDLLSFIVRPPEYLLDSRQRELDLAVQEREFRRRADLYPNRRSVVEKECLLCPECGWDLNMPCENCRRLLRLDWDTCPYCATVHSKKEYQLVGG